MNAFAFRVSGAVLPAVAALWFPVLLLAQSVDDVLQQLKPISLRECELRQIAGKDHFEPYLLNPVLATGTAARVQSRAVAPPREAGPGNSQTEVRKVAQWDSGALGSASVIKVGPVYHLYYEAWGRLTEQGTPEEYGTLQIGHAVSLDGVHWAKDPANPVVPRGTGGEWDRVGTWDPFVIFEDGRFKMWYGGDDGKHGAWGYAVSQDGSRFEKRGRISPFGQVEDIHVAHDRACGEYRLYYWDREGAPWDEVMKGPPAPSGLFVARSRNETDFDFDHAQRLTVAGQAWPAKYSHVLPYRDKWVMFFGEAVTRGNASSTGVAFSQDGMDWRRASFPLVPGHDAEVVEAAPGLWLMYYGPNAYFDWPRCDLRLAIYQGTLEELHDHK
jgi:hypothetical protein